MNCIWCKEDLKSKDLSWFGRHHKLCPVCEDEYRVALNAISEFQGQEMRRAQERALKFKDQRHG